LVFKKATTTPKKKKKKKKAKRPRAVSHTHSRLHFSPPPFFIYLPKTHQDNDTSAKYIYNDQRP
jgi:hypothetical protein